MTMAGPDDDALPILSLDVLDVRLAALERAVTIDRMNLGIATAQLHRLANFYSRQDDRIAELEDRIAEQAELLFDVIAALVDHVVPVKDEVIE